MSHVVIVRKDVALAQTAAVAVAKHVPTVAPRAVVMAATTVASGATETSEMNARTRRAIAWRAKATLSAQRSWQ